MGTGQPIQGAGLCDRGAFPAQRNADIQFVAFRSAALNKGEALKMISETRSYALLLGARGEEQKDIDVVVDTVIKTATIIRKVPRVTDIEINPIVVYEKGNGVKAVDVRILITK